MSLNKILPVLFLASLLAISCAKETEETDESIQRRILDAYLKTNNYQDIKPTASGLYILQSTPGEGSKVVEDSSYAFVQYTSQTLDGTYSSYLYDSIAKALGTYSRTNYYKSVAWDVETINKGLKEALMGMKVGGTTKVIIPPWLIDTETGQQISSSSVCAIYDIAITGITDDIYQYQLDTLQSFSDTHYGGIDTTQAGFYFLQTLTSEKDTIAEGRSVSVRYVGKYLDGQLFDTNIPDTAKFYKIYSGSDGNYTALSMKFYQNLEKAVEENSSVSGFSKAVGLMRRYGDRCVTFFNSDHGYKDEGSWKSSGSGIPPFCPLFFEIWIENDKD